MSVKVWDRADGRSNGFHLLGDLTNDPVKSLSRRTLTLLIHREGCDGKTDFLGRNDRCGVCRGKDNCVGCDGVPNSGARISNYIYYSF